MKIVLSIVIAFLTQSAFGDSKTKLIGSEPDYLGTAAEKIGAPGEANATGSFMVEKGQGLFGWYLRKVDISTWPTIPHLFAFRLREALQSDGWIVPESGIRPPDSRLFPAYFMISATRKHEIIEIIITIIPQENGKLGIAYSQRRSPKSPN